MLLLLDFLDNYFLASWTEEGVGRTGRRHGAGGGQVQGRGSRRIVGQVARTPIFEVLGFLVIN